MLRTGVLKNLRSLQRPRVAFTLNRFASDIRSLPRFDLSRPALILTAILSGVIGYSISSHFGNINGGHYPPQYGTPSDFQSAIRDLISLFPSPDHGSSSRHSIVSTDPDVLDTHGMSPFLLSHEKSSPSVVVFPQSTEDVVKIVGVANKWKMPIIPYSGGTSLEGHTLGVRK
jgi:D-lactate dehydrogenase (cytochrome)